MSNDFVYRLVMCSKFEEKEGSITGVDFGSKDEVGLFKDKQTCVDILSHNTMDVCSTVYNYAYIESVPLDALYFHNGDKDIYRVENVTIMNGEGKLIINQIKEST